MTLKADKNVKYGPNLRGWHFKFLAFYRVQADWKNKGSFSEKNQIQTGWRNPSGGEVLPAQARWMNLGRIQLGKKSVEIRKEESMCGSEGGSEGAGRPGCEQHLISPSGHNSPANAGPQVRPHTCQR